MSPASSARQVALDLIGAVLRRKRPLDDAIDDNSDIAVNIDLPNCGPRVSIYSHNGELLCRLGHAGR